MIKEGKTTQAFRPLPDVHDLELASLFSEDMEDHSIRGSLEESQNPDILNRPSTSSVQVESGSISDDENISQINKSFDNLTRLASSGFPREEAYPEATDSDLDNNVCWYIDDFGQVFSANPSEIYAQEQNFIAPPREAANVTIEPTSTAIPEVRTTTVPPTNSSVTTVAPEEILEEHPSNELWFIPPSSASYDTTTGVLEFEGELIPKNLISVKTIQDRRVFRPIDISNQAVARLLECSSLQTKSILRKTPKLPLFELLSSPILGKRTQPDCGWELSEDRNLICNLSDETKEILRLNGKSKRIPTKLNLPCKIQGGSDVASQRFFETMNAPCLTPEDSVVGGPLEHQTSKLSKQMTETDLRRRQTLLNLTSSKSALEMALSLTSHQALSDLSLDPQAYIHLSFVRKTLEGSIRLLNPVLDQVANSFINDRNSMMLQGSKQILTDSVSEILKEGDPFVPNLWSKETKDQAIEAARNADRDKTLRFAKKAKHDFSHSKGSVNHTDNKMNALKRLGMVPMKKFMGGHIPGNRFPSTGFNSQFRPFFGQPRMPGNTFQNRNSYYQPNQGQSRLARPFRPFTATNGQYSQQRFRMIRPIASRYVHQGIKPFRPPQGQKAIAYNNQGKKSSAKKQN